jgi:trk system potassium uptake protein TrkA
MRTLILGAGAVGVALAKRLLEEKQNIMLIDNDASILRDLNNVLDCPVVFNDNDIVDVLREVNPKTFSHFIAVTGVDEINLLACQLVAGMNPDIITVARVRSAAYTPLIGQDSKLLGLDYIMDSQKAVAEAIAASVQHGRVGNTLYFGESSFQMRTQQIEQGNPLLGKSLKELCTVGNDDILIPLVLRDNACVVPHGHFVLREDDMVYFLGEEKQLAPFFEYEGSIKAHIRRLIIAGGDEIGQSIVAMFYEKQPAGLWGQMKQRLRRSSMEIVVIEKSEVLCRTLAERFPKVLLIKADAMDEGILRDHVIKDYDLFVACQDNQERNILLAAQAKVLGISRSVAVVDDYSYARLVPKLEIDDLLSQRDSLVNALIKIVLGKQIRRVHSLLGGEVEIVEISIDPESKIIKQTVKDIAWPDDSLAIFVQRGNNYLIPHGDMNFEANDVVGILCLSGESMVRVRGYFEK